MKGGEIELRNTPNINCDNLRGFKVKLYPTEEQAKFLLEQIALFRWVYNWVIDYESKALDETGLFVSMPEVDKELQKLRKELPWLKKLPLNSARIAVHQCDIAWDNFFKHKARRPRYKSKKLSKSKQAFHFSRDPWAFYFKDGYVKISGLSSRGEMIQCKTVPFDTNAAKYKCGVIYDGIDFWLTVGVEVDRSYLLETETTDEVLGIDVGCINFAYLSNGKVYNAPNLRRLLKQKSQNSRRLSKMLNRRIKESQRARTKLEDIPESKNEHKLYLKQRKILRRITNIKRNYVHTITTEIANTYPKAIVVEALDIGEMMNRKFLSNKGDPQYVEIYSMWAKFRDYLKYKSAERGIKFIMADRNFHSTKICSNCGMEHYPLKNRMYKCPNCGLYLDRDYNAALNLRNYGISVLG